MRFPTAAVGGFLLALSTCTSQTITEKEPIFRTDNGASVYNTPASGGTIQIKLGSNLSVFHDPIEESPPVSEVEVDLSKLYNLESDSIEIDLGEGAIQFVRDRTVDLHTGSNRRRKLRRVEEVTIKEDSVEDVVECFLDGTCSQEHYDYLPPNGVFDEGDPTQKFQYFEGKALFQQAEATVYVKSMVHPKGLGKYLSGIIVTKRYEYIFRLDPKSNKTFLTQLDPETFPGMPKPIRPEDVEDLDDVVEIGGRRTTMRQEMIKEQEEIGRLLEAEKERKRRLGGERSLQTDDGSVLDIMVCIVLTQAGLSCFLLMSAVWLTSFPTTLHCTGRLYKVCNVRIEQPSLSLR